MSYILQGHYNSDAAVKAFRLYTPYSSHARAGLLLLIHGEVTEHHIDIFDREKVFIDTHLGPIVDAFPKLKVVFEHITTADAASFVAGASGTMEPPLPSALIVNRNIYWLAAYALITIACQY